MRTRTESDYSFIVANVRGFIQEHHGEDVTLDDYLKDSPWSRRSVQRALSHHHTGWRKLLAEERSRHER
jgi:hypothetical protein